ncbi:MAG: DNA alkylation repair enzyme, partial [Alistipes senegalensis]|nr:DNA alkylation repair enzyme [Alistipes senegalensis]
MDFTSRMAALLGAFRRERNGAVADSMRLYGKPYGLNYGVSLPTLRTLARAEGTDHEFARYLYQQDVRCLR